MILRKNITSVSAREILCLTAPFQLIKYRSHLLSGGLICWAQSSRGIQLDAVGGAQRSGFRQLRVILGSGSFQKLKAYFMVCLSILAGLGIDSNFHHDLCIQNTNILFSIFAENVTSSNNKKARNVIFSWWLHVWVNEKISKCSTEVNLRSTIIEVKVKRVHHFGNQFRACYHVWLSCSLQYKHWLFYPEFKVSIREMVRAVTQTAGDKNTRPRKSDPAVYWV